MRHLNDFEKMCDVYAVKMVYGIWVEILWVVNQSKYNVIYYSQPFSIEDVMWQPLQYEFYLKWEILSARRFFFSFFFATNFAWVFLKFILFFLFLICRAMLSPVVSRRFRLQRPCIMQRRADWRVVDMATYCTAVFLNCIHCWMLPVLTKEIMMFFSCK